MKFLRGIFSVLWFVLTFAITFIITLLVGLLGIMLNPAHRNTRR
jgi:hypothetical protein